MTALLIPLPLGGRTDGRSELVAPIIAVLVAALIWSSSFAVTKVTLAQVPPMTIGALRFIIAATLLALLVHCQKGTVLPTRRQRFFIGLAGLLGITAYFAVENLGVDLASASDAALIVASYPIIMLVVELIWGKVNFSAVRALGMALAIGGVWLVVQKGSAEASGDHRLVGDLLLIIGGVVWAAYNLLAQRDMSGASPLVVTYYQTMAGAAGFVGLSLSEVNRWSMPSGGDWARIGFLAIFCSVVAFLLYNYGLRRLVPSVAVNLLNIVPVAGLMWAVTLAGESLNVMQVVGGMIVIVGVTLGLYRSGQQGPHDPTMKLEVKNGR